GGAFAACTSPTEYTGLAVGDHTFEVRATDASSNTDATPESFPWTIKAVTIDLDISPDTTTWGSEVSAQGVADLVDLSLSAELDWGDGTTVPLNVVGGSWGPETHMYANAGTYNITASLKDGTTVKASSSENIVITKRNAILDVSVPDLVIGETKFVANGTLKDASTHEGIDGLTIEFAGDGAPGDVTTQGVGFVGVIELESCAVDGSACVHDDIRTDTDTPSNNVVLHLKEGGKITFPQSTSKVRIVLQDMGATPFTYTIREYPDTPLQCADQDPGVVVCPATSYSDAPLEIIAESGSSATGGVTVFNGIKEITFSPVDIGIAALATRNEDSNPQDLLQINFEDLALGPRPSGFTVEGGSFFSYGVAQLDPANGLSLVAHLATNELYNTPDVSVSYNVLGNLQEAPGVGANEGTSGTGTSLAKRGTSGDLDKDGLGDTDEGNCLTRNPSIAAQTWTIAPSPSYASSSDCPKKGGVAGSRPDLYYEVDCMSGVICPTQANLDLLEKAFDDASSSKDINAHFHLSDTGICGSNQNVVAWSDGDATLCND
ncbi:MAG: hypothetical protein ACRD5H_10710, partial [Nitrososphaerales archaeon]